MYGQRTSLIYESRSTDYKHVWDYGILKDGDSVGCDFAGDVVELGKNAQGSSFKVGDAVAGFIRGGAIDPANGTFQGGRTPRVADHIGI